MVDQDMRSTVKEFVRSVLDSMAFIQHPLQWPWHVLIAYAGDPADAEIVGVNCVCAPEGDEPLPTWSGPECGCLKETETGPCVECWDGFFGANVMRALAVLELRNATSTGSVTMVSQVMEHAHAI